MDNNAILSDLYRVMVRAREFELAVAALWQRGAITGEMHAGLGEEAIAAGVAAHLEPTDWLALTHRCTPFVIARGVPMNAVLCELLGRADGLCGGNSGHMHLMSRDHRFVTSGIVGASLPAGAGFALAAQRTRSGAIAVAQTGDGALNQGMALETLNLAVVWALPLLLVCIDNGWAITTPAGSMTGGDLRERVASFGWHVAETDGADPSAVSETAADLIDGVRNGRGPALLYARAPRLEGHFLGDPLLRIARSPLAEGKDVMRRIFAGARAADTGLASRAGAVSQMVDVMRRARATPRTGRRGDPLVAVEKRLGTAAGPIAAAEREAVRTVVASAMGTDND